MKRRSSERQKRSKGVQFEDQQAGPTPWWNYPIKLMRGATTNTNTNEKSGASNSKRRRRRHYTDPESRNENGNEDEDLVEEVVEDVVEVVKWGRGALGSNCWHTYILQLLHSL